MADLVVTNLAGLFAAQLGTTRCQQTYLHDVRRAVGRSEMPALAVYVSEEEIVESLGGRDVHEATVALDYYLGPVEQEVMDSQWADLREAARLVSVAVRNGYHANWPTPIVPAPDPPQSPAPGTPLLTLLPALLGFSLRGKIRYGYFHPLSPGAGASYLGFRAQLDVRHEDTIALTGVTNLGPLVGHFTVPAEGVLPAASFLEFQAFGAP